jgi:hypothetical protein
LKRLNSQINLRDLRNLLIDTELYKKLISVKDKISVCKKWEKWAKLTNPYEKFKKSDKDYYKFYEILKFYDLDVNDLEKCWTSVSIERNGNSVIDLSEPFSKPLIGESLIVGNGSVDTKHDPNNQEQLNLYVFYTEVLTALNNQKKDGTFIMKIYDTLTRPTCQLIYFLSRYYDVSIIKPRVSRLTNSEKFVVARNFKGISREDLTKLNKIEWDPSNYCRTFNIDVPDEDRFNDFNTLLVHIQINYIEKTMFYSYSDNNDVENQFDAFQNKKTSDLSYALGLEAQTLSDCRHTKKTKVKYRTLDCSLCDRCFCLLKI